MAGSPYVRYRGGLAGLWREAGMVCVLLETRTAGPRPELRTPLLSKDNLGATVLSKDRTRLPLSDDEVQRPGGRLLVERLLNAPSPD